MNIFIGGRGGEGGQHSRQAGNRFVSFVRACVRACVRRARLEDVTRVEQPEILTAPRSALSLFVTSTLPSSLLQFWKLFQHSFEFSIEYSFEYYFEHSFECSFGCFFKCLLCSM